MALEGVDCFGGFLCFDLTEDINVGEGGVELVR